jgi:RHS repeat-associated protein
LVQAKQKLRPSNTAGQFPKCSLANQNYKFNGKERDAESCAAGSCLDNFGARYDSPNLGRFMTPDWAARPTAVPYAVLGDPQSLNLYAFVRNDPVSRADADGHAGLCAYRNSGVQDCNPWDTNIDSEHDNQRGRTRNCTNATCGDQAPPPKQPSGKKAQKQTSQLVVTMKVIVPDKKITRNQREEVVGFGIAKMDEKGDITPISDTDQHKLITVETLDKAKSKGKEPDICQPACVADIAGTQVVEDTMRISRGMIVVLDKRFAIDAIGVPAKVYDPDTHRARDFVHEESTFKTGTTLTFGDD